MPMDIRFGLPVKSLEIVDGDTLKVVVELTEYIRLTGVDTPELRDTLQKRAAEVVRLAVKRWISWQDYISVNPIGYDKYGQRVICVVNGSAGRDLGEWLVVEGLANYYDGRQKKPWTQEALEGIEERRAEFE